MSIATLTRLSPVTTAPPETRAPILARCIRPNPRPRAVPCDAGDTDDQHVLEQRLPGWLLKAFVTVFSGVMLSAAVVVVVTYLAY